MVLDYIYIILIFIIGYFAVYYSQKYRFPKILALIIIGFLLKYFKELFVLNFQDTSLLLSIAAVSLTIAAFEASSKVNLKKFNNDHNSLQVSAITFFLTAITLTFFTYLLFEIPVLIAILFAVIISATEHDELLHSLKKKNKVTELLKKESIFTLPKTIVLAALVYSYLFIETKSFLAYTLPIFMGVGVGAVIGIIYFDTKRKFYKNILKPVPLILALSISYLGAEAIGGNGILSAATFGIIFSHIHLKKKEILNDFMDKLFELLEILAVILFLVLFDFKLTPKMFALSIIIYLIYLIARFCAFSVGLTHKGFGFKQKLFLTLDSPNGKTIFIIMLWILLNSNAYLETILTLALLFSIYSIIVSYLTLLFEKKLL